MPKIKDIFINVMLDTKKNANRKIDWTKRKQKN